MATLSARALAVPLAVPALLLAGRALRAWLRARAVVSTTRAPAAIGPYSQAVRAGALVFVSGQIPLDPQTGALVDGGIEAQAKRSLENLKAIVEASGCTMRDVVKCTILLADMGDFAKVNDVYASFFAEPFPARAAFAVKALPKGALIEIECVAALP